MIELLSRPWPWYVSGPLLGLFVPALLLLGNKQLGVSGSLRAICAASTKGRVDFFRYDWKEVSAWNLAFVSGVLIGGVVMSWVGVQTPTIADSTKSAITRLGLSAPSGLVPSEIFSWTSLMTLRGWICMAVGGFLVGFGASYAGGCTSGHGITGLATLQKASLYAMIGIFAGGLFATYAILPLVLSLGIGA